jgi:hypothetical protein
VAPLLPQSPPSLLTVRICHAAIKYIRDLTAENERLRAENGRQAQELADRHSHDPEQASSGEVAITADANDNDDDNDDVVLPKAELSAEGE